MRHQRRRHKVGLSAHQCQGCWDEGCTVTPHNLSISPEKRINVRWSVVIKKHTVFFAAWNTCIASSVSGSRFLNVMNRRFCLSLYLHPPPSTSDRYRHARSVQTGRPPISDRSPYGQPGMSGALDRFRLSRYMMLPVRLPHVPAQPRCAQALPILAQASPSVQAR